MMIRVERLSFPYNFNEGEEYEPDSKWYNSWTPNPGHKAINHLELAEHTLGRFMFYGPPGSGEYKVTRIE